MHTVKPGHAYFDWYLEPSKRGNDRVTSFQENNKKLLETISELTEKAMATHSSTLAWKIPWMEEPGGLQSMGLQRVGHD